MSTKSNYRKRILIYLEINYYRNDVELFTGHRKLNCVGRKFNHEMNDCELQPKFRCALNRAANQEFLIIGFELSAGCGPNNPGAFQPPGKMQNVTGHVQPPLWCISGLIFRLFHDFFVWKLNALCLLICTKMFKLHFE